jgi:transposase InsO family protein
MLEREGPVYSRSYIGLLMKDTGLRGVLRRKFILTTNSNHSYLTKKNELNREFSSFKLEEKWVSDISYIRVNDDWDYLTTIF